jgi:hypothetical protein
MAEVGRPRRVWWRWAVAPVLASAVAVAVWLWPVERAVLPAPAAVKAQMPAPPLVSVRRLVRVMRPGPRILPTGDPNFVRVKTGNPDVVILWSLNSEGEEE